MLSVFLVAVTITGLAQSQTTSSPEMKTYILTLQDGQKVPVFWDPKQEDKDWIHLQKDEPWQPQPTYWSGKTSDIAQKRLEIPSVREQRIRDGWNAQGFVDVKGRHVLASEKGWSDRARELAGIPVAGFAGNADPASTAASTAPAAEDSRPVPAGSGFAWSWAAYAGLAVVAVLLMIVVARTMVFTGNN